MYEINKKEKQIEEHKCKKTQLSHQEVPPQPEWRLRKAVTGVPLQLTFDLHYALAPPREALGRHKSQLML